MHMAQWMPLPITISCFSKIQIGFTFLVPAHPGSPGQRAVKRVCVCVCVWGGGVKYSMLHTFMMSCLRKLVCVCLTVISLTAFSQRIFKHKTIATYT